jgi:hypothetical protein
MFNKFQTAILLILALAIPLYAESSSIAANTTNIKKIDYGATVAISGLVYIEYFYEEPYDESPDSDAIAGACLIKLDSTNLFALENGQNIKVSHLIIPDEVKVNCAKLVGHRVQIIGKIGEIHTGHHHGDSLLFVNIPVAFHI